VSEAVTGIGVSALVDWADEAALLALALCSAGRDREACEGVVGAAAAVAGSAHTAAHTISVRERRTRRG
jgi:hypothetical protein